MDKRQLKKLNILWVCSGTSCNYNYYNEIDPILDCKGIGESYIVAHDLILACLQSRIPIDAIYSSKFANAIETAEMIYRELKKAEAKIEQDCKESINKHKTLIESYSKSTRRDYEKSTIAEKIRESINKLPMQNLLGPSVKKRISILPFIGENNNTYRHKILEPHYQTELNEYNPEDIVIDSIYQSHDANSPIFNCSPRHVPDLLQRIGEEMFFSPENRKNEYNVVITTHSSFLREMFDLHVKSGQIFVQRDVFGQNLKGIGQTPYFDSFVDIYSNDCQRCNDKSDEFLLENNGAIMVRRNYSKIQNQFHEEEWYINMLKTPAVAPVSALEQLQKMFK